MGPKMPSTAPGLAAGSSLLYAVSPCWSADTSGPVDPWESCGVFGSAGSAAQVSGPTIPSSTRPSLCWNDRTAPFAAPCAEWSVGESVEQADAMPLFVRERDVKRAFEDFKA